MTRFRRIERLSTWRRIAVHAWDAPTDPTVYGTLEVDATEAIALIRQLREQTGVKLTVTHLVGRAIALAIRARPEVNSIVRHGTLYQRDTIDIFFQVATEGGENLAGYKIDRVDEKSILEIAQELQAGAGKVRKGDSNEVKTSSRLAQLPPRLAKWIVRGSTFASYELGIDLSKFGIPYDGFGTAMVTNVGGFGLSSGLAALCPLARCSILLLVGEIQERPVVREGRIVVRSILPIGATFDHRILDGYQAGRIAQKFKHALENPTTELAPTMPLFSATRTAPASTATPKTDETERAARAKRN